MWTSRHQEWQREDESRHTKPLGTGAQNGRRRIGTVLVATVLGAILACGDEPPVATSVSVSPGSLWFAALGDTSRLTAQVRDQYGELMEGVAIAWESGDGSVATVDANGLVRSAGNGVVPVKATAGGTSGSASVTVEQVVSAVSVSPERLEFMALGDTVRLSATAVDANGHSVASAAIEWASGAPAVATVDSTGLLHAVGYGTTTVTATSGSVSGSAQVLVSADRIERAALRALFEATGGPGWTRNNNWMSDGPLRDWHGVAVNDHGRVEYLRLENNNLTGSLPAEIGDLGALTELLFTGNNLTGPLPAKLGNLSELELLGLERNGISGEIPVSLGGLSSLKVLSLGFNQLTGRIPAEFGRLSNLTILNLQANRGLTGPIPPELGDLSSLEWMYLHYCDLTGEIPAELGNLTALTQLNLSLNRLSGPIPPAIGNLSSLWQLNLEVNNLTGPLPPELGNLSNLEWFSAWNNEIDGPIPPEFGNLPSLKTIYIAQNRLSGSIPPELGNFPSMDQLLLWGNELTGPIPAELADMPRLRILNLSRNQLSGEIPPGLARAPSLRVLDVRRNGLSGPLPPGLFDSRTLINLLLGWNELSGPVPPEVSNLRTLGILDLTDNAEMSGPLPSTMTTLEEMTVIATVGTDLCAPGDRAFQDWLGGVRQGRVALCDPAEAYLTQAVQSREYPVPLVADERALLRVFVTAGQESDATIPRVVARFYLNGSEVHTVEIPAGSAIIPTAVNEGSLETSSNVEIPGSVLRPGMEMVIEIDPDDMLDPDLGVPKRIPAEGRAPLDVREMPTFEATFIPFLWSQDPDSSVLDLTGNMTADHEVLWETRTLLPVNEMTVEVHDPVETSSNNIHDVLAQALAIRAAEGGSGYWQGLIGNPTGAAGVAVLNGWVSAARLDESTIAHEFGHGMGLLHAPCGNAPQADSYFPHQGGAIGAWGYEFESNTLIPPSIPDLMGYCRWPRPWMSEYHFARALRVRVSKEVGASAVSAAAGQSLLLWGGVDADGAPYLEPAFVIDAAPVLPSGGGEYRLAGADADGGELFALSFDMPELADGDGGSSFAFTLPARPEWTDALASVTLTGPDGAAILDRDSDIPMAILRDPRTGQVRGFMRGPQWGDPATAEEAARRIERDLEVLSSRGIPVRAAWRR